MTPEEIEGYVPPRSLWGGYRPDKVVEHMRRVAWDVRRMVHDHGVAQAEIDRLRRDLARFERREELDAALIRSAQTAAREMRDAAQQEAELVLKKANEHAERIRAEVAREYAHRTQELEGVKNANLKLRGELRGFVKALLELLEPPAGAERRLVMADLERVVRSTRIGQDDARAQPAEEVADAPPPAPDDEPRASGHVPEGTERVA